VRPQQDLLGQAQQPAGGGQGQAGVAQDPPRPRARQDRQLGDVQGRDVELGAVVGDQHDLVGGGHLPTHRVRVRGQDGGVADPLGREEPVGRVELSGVGELVRPGAPGPGQDWLGQPDQPGGASPVAEFGTGEVRRPERPRQALRPVHGVGS
jgi:hypothetical protein